MLSLQAGRRPQNLPLHLNFPPTTPPSTRGCPLPQPVHVGSSVSHNILSTPYPVAPSSSCLFAAGKNPRQSFTAPLLHERVESRPCPHGGAACSPPRGHAVIRRRSTHARRATDS